MSQTQVFSLTVYIGEREYYVSRYTIVELFCILHYREKWEINILKWDLKYYFYLKMEWNNK